MDDVAKLPAEDREALFRETAAQMGIGSAVITEKDFWVCWVLKHLFEISDSPRLLFKGGTSLSKVFGLIERFSEDIDLSLDRVALGFGGEDDPRRIDGNKTRKKSVEALEAKCNDHVHRLLLPPLRSHFGSILGNDGWRIAESVNQNGAPDIRFEYPRSLQPEDYGKAGYISPAVRLEFGATSDHHPSETSKVRSYAAAQYPDMFKEPVAKVVVLKAERTFWEKATIFHAENNRPEGKSPPPAWTRLSRHAYDLVMLDRHGVAESAIADTDLLKAVAEHKRAFFYTGWAEYDKAAPGTFRLAPNEALEDALRQDYRKMADMFFGAPPPFGELLEGLRDLDVRINASR